MKPNITCSYSTRHDDDDHDYYDDNDNNDINDSYRFQGFTEKLCISETGSTEKKSVLIQTKIMLFHMGTVTSELCR
jgi:hypothetical protein